MNVARRPYFHYVCVDTDGGGQATRPGLSLRSTNGTDGTVVIHELGHNLGLSHGGFETFNAKPHYVSVMNYGFPGDRAPTLNNGNTHFSRNANSAQLLNPEQLCENITVGANSTQMVGLTTQWYLGTTANSVDWNRDGTATPHCLTKATAPVNWPTRRNAAPGAWTNADAFGTQRADFAPAAGTSYPGTPALVATTEGATDARLYAFYPVINSAGQDYIRHRSGLFPDGKCANSVTSFAGDCVDFGPEISTSRRGQAVSAAVFLYNAQPVIFLAVRENTGALKIYHSTGLLGGILQFTLEKTVTASGATREPSLAVANGQLHLVYLQADGLSAPLLKWARRLANGSWSLPVAVGAGLRSTTDPTLALNPNDQKLYLLRTRTNGGINDAVQFLVLDAATGTWSPSPTYDLDTAFSPDGLLRTSTRPGLAWRPHDLGTPAGPGGWLITTTTQPNITYRTEMSYFDGNTDYGAPDANPNADLITGKLSADAKLGGVTLLNDSRLRHVQGAYIRDTGALRLMPYADGIFSYGLKDHDDYPYLAVGPCRSLRGTDCPITSLPPFYPLTSSEDNCDWEAP